MIWWEIQGFSRAANIQKMWKKHGFLWKTDLPMIGLLYLFFSFSRSIEQALKHGILQQTWDIYVYVLYVYIHVYTLFTPLRVGWPPTPQVYFGPWEGLRVVSPVGAPQAREFSLFPPVGAPQAREFSLFPPWGLPKLGNFPLFPPVGAPQAREFSLFPPVGAPQAREFSLFPPVTASQAMEFSLFPPFEALQAAEFQIARQRRLDSPPNPVFFECVSMFLQWFPSKHGTLHFCRHKTGRKHHVRQCFQFPYLPNRWKYRYLQCFLQFFHVPMPVANSNIYIRNPSKTLFLTVFFQCFQSNRR